LNSNGPAAAPTNPQAVRIANLRTAAAGGPNRSRIVQRMMLETAPIATQPNAGTKPLAFTTDGEYVVKVGSEREEFTYTNRAVLGLDQALVGSAQAQAVIVGELVTAVIIGDERKDLTASIRAPKAELGERLIVTERLGRGKKNDTFTMDIKIGFETKSGEQFELEGASWLARQGKKVEHNLKDSDFGPRMGPFFHGSSERGFDVDPNGAAAFRAHSKDKTFNACLRKILADIMAMHDSMLKPSIVFVGASLFCFFDLEIPANSSARILDPDHPILLEDKGANQPPTLMREETLKEQQKDNWVFNRGWKSYSRKYADSFMHGLEAIYHALRKKAI
jgi:hypothetical protein